MNSTQQLVADLNYLEAVGLTTDQLRSLHHWSDRPDAAARVTFSTARNYFEGGQEMKANNAAFAERLRFVAALHQRGLAAIVEQALAQYPK